MKAYYNSVAAFEGQWYLFVTDENDIYIVHPLLPRLIGTDIKDVERDGFEPGKELVMATEEEPVWVEYLWPHPATLTEVPKVGYAVRHDGLLFASGYHPGPGDPADYTKSYVQAAIDYYQEEGREATVAHYGSEASVEGQWYLVLIDENDRYLVNLPMPILIGADAKMGKALGGRPVGQEIVEQATEEGAWISFLAISEQTADGLMRHLWTVRHDGLIFLSSYFTEPDEPGPE